MRVRCCCSEGHVRGWGSLIVLSAACLGGAAAYLFTRVGPLAVSIGCVADSLTRLIADGGRARQLASAVPTAVLDGIRQYREYLSYAALFPAALCIVSMLLSVACGYRRDTKAYTCTKLTNAVSQLLLLAALGIYGVLTALGIAMEAPTIRAELRTVTSTCSTGLPLLQADVVSAQATVDSCASSPGCIVSAADQAVLSRAQTAVAEFSEMCQCMESLFSGFKPLTLPAALCAGAILLCYIGLEGMCVSAGCCCTNAAKRRIIAQRFPPKVEAAEAAAPEEAGSVHQAV